MISPLETTRAALAAAQSKAPAPVTLHPRLPEIYAQRVGELRSLLATARPARRRHRYEPPFPPAPEPPQALVDALRALIVRIDVEGDQVTLHGTLAALLGDPEHSRAAGSPRLYNVVAGAGLSAMQTPPTVKIAC